MLGGIGAHSWSWDWSSFLELGIRKAAGATQVSEFQSPPSIHSPIIYQLLKMFSIKVPFEIEVRDYSVCLVFACDFFSPLVTNERELLFSCAFLFYFF